MHYSPRLRTSQVVSLPPMLLGRGDVRTAHHLLSESAIRIDIHASEGSIDRPHRMLLRRRQSARYSRLLASH